MRNIFRYIIITFIIFIGVFTLIVKYPHWIREKKNSNSIEVIINNDIDFRAVKVIWGYDPDDGEILFQNGKELKVTYKKYGYNFFTICYNDSVIAKFSQYKYNNWHGHQYTFNISKRNDSLVVDWAVIGPDTARLDKQYPKMRAAADNKKSIESVDASDCIFDQVTQTDSFLKNIPELSNYIWDSDSHTATVQIDSNTTLFIFRGGCYSFGVSAEFHITNSLVDSLDWKTTFSKVLWISSILESEFNYDLLKNDIDSDNYKINETQDGEIVSFSNEYLQNNRYSIERRHDGDISIIIISWYID